MKIVRDVRERIEAEERLRQAEQHLRVVEDRERIARDLHDIVIQKLFAAGMTIQSVSARSADAEHGHRLARSSTTSTRRSGRSVRSSSASRPTLATAAACAREVLRVTDDGREALGFEPRIRFDGPVDTMDQRSPTSCSRPCARRCRTSRSTPEASRVEIVVESGETGEPPRPRQRSRDAGRALGRERDPQSQRARRHEARWDLPRLVAPRRRHGARVAGTGAGVSQERSTSGCRAAGRPDLRSSPSSVPRSRRPLRYDPFDGGRPYGVVHVRFDLAKESQRLVTGEQLTALSDSQRFVDG